MSSEHGDSASSGCALDRCLISPRSLLPQFPGVGINGELLARIRHGNPVNLPEYSGAGLVKVFEGGSDRLVAIVRRVAGTLFQPKVVLT